MTQTPRFPLIVPANVNASLAGDHGVSDCAYWSKNGAYWLKKVSLGTNGGDTVRTLPLSQTAHRWVVGPAAPGTGCINRSFVPSGLQKKSVVSRFVTVCTGPPFTDCTNSPACVPSGRSIR